MPGVVSLGHIGVAVLDVDGMLDFYTRVLGLTITDGLGARGAFLSAQPTVEHHEFVVGKAERQTNAQLITFSVDSLADLRELYHAVLADGRCSQVRGVNHGISLGCAFLDPEGNRVELYWSTGMDYPQPHAEPIDLDQTDSALLASVAGMPPRVGTLEHRYGTDAGKRLSPAATV
jgi:catechol 2,3-dioxygenase-like lactoylglutathione lyase family enzyme